MSNSVRPHRRQPTRLPRPWDSPGKNTGVGCHFLLQCMKVKSESGVAQSCPTLCDPMDCSPPGSSIHGIFQARVLEWGAIAQGSNPYPLHCKVDSLPLDRQGGPWVFYIYIYNFFRFLSIINYYKILNIVPCGPCYLSFSNVLFMTLFLL